MGIVCHVPLSCHPRVSRVLSGGFKVKFLRVLVERKKQKEVEPPRMKGTVEESRHVGNEREREGGRERRKEGEKEKEEVRDRER